MKRKIILAFLSFVFSISTFNSYAEKEVVVEEKEAIIGEKVSDDSTPVGSVALPTVGETMMYFDKLKQKLFVPKPVDINSNDPLKLAMNLGLSTADAAAALKNKDIKLFDTIGIKIISYAIALNIGENVLSDAFKVNQLVKNKEWEKVDFILDRMRGNLIFIMLKKNKQNEVALASLSGWVEGLYIMTETVKGNFSSNFDDAFFIGGILGYLIKNLESAPENIKKMKEYPIFMEELPKINKIVSKEHINKDDLNLLNSSAKKIRNIIIK